MSISLEGKVAIVTGAANGIGRAIAKAFAAARARVILADILVEDGERTQKEITDAGGEAIFVRADVSEEDDVKNMVAAGCAAFRSIDILVNNAGGGGSLGRLHEIETREFDRTINANLRSTFLCTKFVIPHFLAKNAGDIVNIASTYGLVGAPKVPAYCAAKAAIINLTRQLAVDYREIRVNAICPGYIDTGLGRRRATLTEAELTAALARREKAARMQPLGRQGRPEEVANVALFLCSDAASFMTGSIVTVDGGCITTFNYGDAAN
jgi:NAD(P)-dependent dehydrogenase (short-subunit alcohol dehydrogenase family)